LEAKQAIKEGIDNQLKLPVADLNTHWKRKGKVQLHSLWQSTKRSKNTP
jgi:hypothetical protein